MTGVSSTAGRAGALRVGPETPLSQLTSSDAERQRARCAVALQVGSGAVSAPEAVELLDMLGLREPRDVARAKGRIRRHRSQRHVDR